MSHSLFMQADDSRRSVEAYLCSIIRDAERDADLVAAFLKLRGTRSRQNRSLLPDDTVPTGPVADMLLNLAAALRVRSWEVAKLTPLMFPSLSTSRQLLANAVAAAEGSSAAEVKEGPVAVFQAALIALSRNSQETLGTDVVLPTAFNEEELLDQIANFLYEHRHLAPSRLGDESDDA